MNHIYHFQTSLFGTPRIITTNYPVDIRLLETLVNADNDYAPENRWRCVRHDGDWASDKNLKPILGKQFTEV